MQSAAPVIVQQACRRQTNHKVVTPVGQVKPMTARMETCLTSLGNGLPGILTVHLLHNCCVHHDVSGVPILRNRPSDILEIGSHIGCDVGFKI